MIRNELGQFKLTEGKTDWRTINFYEDYVPYYELHTRDDTINYFNITLMTHKTMCKFYNYKKGWNSIHPTKNGHINKNINLIDFDEFKQYYESHTRDETLTHFDISQECLKKLCKQHNYTKPVELIAANVSKQSLINGKSTNIIKFHQLLVDKNFKTKYLDYYETHSREDTCNYFDINRDIHEMLLKEFNYSKPINNIVKLAARNFLFNGINFDSKPELAFYIYYIEHNISIKHEPCQIEYLYENEIHYYIPDFMLQEQLIEIKGEHFFNSDGSMCNPYDHSQDGKYEAKHQCMLTNNVKILKSKDCKFAIDYCINKYGKNWYESYYRKEN